MADHQGFAIVTAALHALIQSTVAAVVPGTTVQIGPPRAVGAVPEKPAVTLTLYHLAANAAWRNADRVSRDPGGGILAPPPLAFDLHYCIAIAGGARLASAQLLGALAAAFAGHPLIPHALLAAVRAADGAYPELAAPGAVAASPADLVQLTPHYPAPVDAAALWPGLFALPHQPSLHLIASPVLIAAGEPPSAPLPVTERAPNL
jgi:hypothetical protein